MSTTSRHPRFASRIALLAAVAAACAQAHGPVRPAHCLANLAGTLQWATRDTCPQLIDATNISGPDSWAPWTHHPSCVNAVHNPKAQFCVFTESGHGYHGISLLTFPEVAAASIDLLQDPYLSLISAPAIDPVLNRGAGNTPAYEIRDIPGKGKGVVATRLIKQYEVFMGDYAAMIVSSSFPGAVRQQDGLALLHQGADQLMHPEALLNLGRSSPGHQSDIVEDIMRTNSFQLEVAGAPHMAMFPEISRLNHACNASAYMRFSPRSFAATVIAFRDIQPGEEITISYAPLGLEHKERQDLLKDWGFTCTCAMCSASADDIASSDTRRKKISDLKEDIMDFLTRGKLHGAIKMIHEVIDLMKLEDLQPLMPEQYETLARIHWALNQKSEALRFAEESIRLLAVHGFMDQKDKEGHLAELVTSFVS